MQTTNAIGNKEDLGITVLDEPALNHEDKTALEMKYLSLKHVPSGIKMTGITVEAIENAEKKPKEITRWIASM